MVVKINLNVKSTSKFTCKSYCRSCHAGNCSDVGQTILLELCHKKYISEEILQSAH